MLACASLARALAHGTQAAFAFPLAYKAAGRFLRDPEETEDIIADGETVSTSKLSSREGDETLQLGE